MPPYKLFFRLPMNFFWKNFYGERLWVFFYWASLIALPEDIISVEIPGYGGYYYFEFPLRYGDKPQKINSLPEGKDVSFIIRQPKRSEVNENWILIFSSPDLEIFESKRRAAETQPLRWKLSQDEKELCLKAARGALERFLSEDKKLSADKKIPLPRFWQKSDFGVALWVNGRLRGSRVLKGRSFAEGITEATMLACRDPRFKPLSAEELSDARIEITIFSDLRLPLSKKELERNEIYPEKGYVLEKDGKEGWFLPEVFNVRRFSNLNQFLGELAEQKAGIKRDMYKSAKISIFEVDDFIESRDHKRAISLHGPVVKQNLEFGIRNLEFRARMAADWLCRIQEPDGSIPPIIDPLTGRAMHQIDWPRLAFSVWALAEFGKAVNEEKYIKAAEKSHEYLTRYLIPSSQFMPPAFELTLAYFGQLSLSLNKSREAATAAEKILARLPGLSFEPITFSQIASFLKNLPGKNQHATLALENLSATLKENFERNTKRGLLMNLAVWAELVNTFIGVDNEFANQVAEWLKNKQLPTGAFPESTGSNSAASITPNLAWGYTRGTGKIFEVLAFEPEKNKAALDNVLKWLFSMQYDEENSYFIPSEIRPRIIGAFRHDYFNPDCWIDAAGHAILGVSRLFKKHGERNFSKSSTLASA